MNFRSLQWLAVSSALTIGVVACTVTTDDDLLDGGTPKTDGGSGGASNVDASTDTGTTTTETGTGDTSTTDTTQPFACVKNGSACNDCRADKCCPELEACLKIPSCAIGITCFDQSDGGTPKDRGEQCVPTDFDTSAETFLAYYTCMYEEKCKDDCIQL